MNNRNYILTIHKHKYDYDTKVDNEEFSTKVYSNLEEFVTDFYSHINYLIQKDNVGAILRYRAAKKLTHNQKNKYTDVLKKSHCQAMSYLNYKGRNLEEKCIYLRETTQSKYRILNSSRLAFDLSVVQKLIKKVKKGKCEFAFTVYDQDFNSYIEYSGRWAENEK